MKQIEIKEKFGYDVYEKYKFMVKDIIGKNFKEKCNSNITFFELENQAWISIMIAHDNYKEDKEVKIETFVYNYIIFGINTYLRANMFTVKVPHVEHTNRIAGYNKMYYKKIKESYEKKKELGLLTEEKIEQILEDTKREFKTINVFELKEHMCEYKCDDVDEQNTIFSKLIIKDDIYVNIEQKDFLTKILLECFKDRILTKKDIEVIREYYNNGIKSLNFTQVMNKLSNYVKNNGYLEDLEEICDEFNKNVKF